MKKITSAILGLGIISFLFIVGIFMWGAEGLPDRDISPGSAFDIQQIDDVTASSCGAAGGVWNSCASYCRRSNDPDVVCPSVCLETCVCGTDAECPTGNSCQFIFDGVGECLPTKD